MDYFHDKCQDSIAQYLSQLTRETLDDLIESETLTNEDHKAVMCWLNRRTFNEY